MISQICISSPVYRYNYSVLNRPSGKTFVMSNDTFTRGLSFKGVVPPSIKLEKEQYAVSNLLSAKEAKITQKLSESLPAGIMLGIISNQENSNQKFKKVSTLQNLYQQEDKLKGTTIYDEAGTILFSKSVNSFANKGQKLEDDLFALNPESSNLKKELKELFKAYNVLQIESEAKDVLNGIDIKKLKIAEIEIFNTAINHPENLDENSKKYIKGVISYIDECIPYLKNKTQEEKLEVLKFADLTNYNAKAIKDELNSKYQEVLLNAKSKKEF